MAFRTLRGKHVEILTLKRKKHRRLTVVHLSEKDAQEKLTC